MLRQLLVPFVRSPLHRIIGSRNTGQTTGQTMTGADRFREVTGVTWDRLWLGDTVDVVAGQALAVRGNAVAGIQVTGLSGGFDRGLSVTDNTPDAFDMADDLATGNSVGDGVVWALVFQITTGVPPAANRSMAGNRAATAPNLGIELLLTTTGGLVAAASDGGTPRFAGARENYAAGQAWHVVALRDRGTPAVTEVATELEFDRTGPSGNLATSADIPWTLGRQRLSSAGMRVAVAAISSAGDALSANLADMAVTIHGALVGS